MAEHVRTPTNKPMKVTDVNTECELRNNNGLTTSLLVSLTLTPLCWLRLLFHSGPGYESSVLVLIVGLFPVGCPPLSCRRTRTAPVCLRTGSASVVVHVATISCAAGIMEIRCKVCAHKSTPKRTLELFTDKHYSAPPLQRLDAETFPRHRRHSG